MFFGGFHLHEFAVRKQSATTCEYRQQGELTLWWLARCTAGPTRDIHWYQESFRDSQCVTLARQPPIRYANRLKIQSMTSNEHDEDFFGVDSPVSAPTRQTDVGGLQNADLVARPRNFAVFAPTPISNVLESWVRHVREGCFEGDSDSGVASNHLADDGRRTMGAPGK